MEPFFAETKWHEIYMCNPPETKQEESYTHYYCAETSQDIMVEEEDDFDSADARLLVSADYFAVDETYEVFVRATNFMGYRSMQKSVLVTRGADNSLPVSIRGGSSSRPSWPNLVEKIVSLSSLFSFLPPEDFRHNGGGGFPTTKRLYK